MNTPAIPLTYPMKYGTVWQRICGAMIDFLIFLPFGLLIAWLNYSSKTAALIDTVPAFAILWGYRVYCNGRFGQTVGMWMMGIRTVKVDGGAISWGQAWLRNSVTIVFDIWTITGRFIALFSISDASYYGVSWNQQGINLSALHPLWWKWINVILGICLFIDILIILFNPKLRALHDFIAGTVVIALSEVKHGESCCGSVDCEST